MESMQYAMHWQFTVYTTSKFLNIIEFAIYLSPSLEEILFRREEDHNIWYL